MKSDRLLKEKNKCSGCGACMTICPKHAIRMKKDTIGNVYPFVDTNKCINCKLCYKVCNYFSPCYNNEDKKSYAAFSNNKLILKNSSSGGIFGTIAKQFILEEGLICGCHLSKENEKFILEHVIVDNVNSLNEVLGSKYVQSAVFKNFKLVQKKLNEGIKILFCGTPCQIAGLKGFLGKEYNNLYTIDLICHGAPNVEIFQNYIAFLNKKKKFKIINVKFRDKHFGWGLNGRITVLKKNSLKSHDIPFYYFDSSYYTLFKEGYLYRENCYTCPFAQKNRIGDITIGDFWGIENELPELKKKSIDGISCVIVNNLHGKELIKNYGKDIKMIEVDYKKISKHNGQLNAPAKRPSNNSKLIKLYKKNGYTAVEEFYSQNFSLSLWKKFMIKLKARIIFCIRKR